MSASQDPARMENDIRPVVWTPEDAARFLTSAIHESQRPLAEALRQRPVTSRALALIVILLVGLAAVSVWILQAQLAKSELSAEKAGQARDAESGQKVELLTRIAALNSRLDTAREDNSRLQAETAALREGEEELRRARSESQRFRRQLDLLRGQISGLEMEKTALSRQLESLKAYALEEDEYGGGPPASEPPATEKLGISASRRPAAEPEAPPAPPAAALILETPASALTVTSGSEVAAKSERPAADPAEALPDPEKNEPAASAKPAAEAHPDSTENIHGEGGDAPADAAQPAGAEVPETAAEPAPEQKDAASAPAEPPPENREHSGAAESSGTGSAGEAPRE